jgi:hypothetical protein
MKTQDKPRFVNLMAGMGELYGKVIFEYQIDFYWDTLKNFELKDVRQAFQSHIHNPNIEQYFPNLRELLRFIAGDHHTTKAEDAWLIVEGVYRRQACYESLALTDPITKIVLDDMGGWMQPRAAILEEMYFYEMEFTSLYCEFLDNTQTEE